MKNLYTTYFLLLISLSGCSVLSDSQFKNINVYATTAKTYANYPGDVVRQYALLSQDNRILKASGFRDTAAVNAGLNSAGENYNLRINLANQFDLSLQLFQQYVGLLFKLSSTDYVNDLSSSSKELGENSTGLVNQYNLEATKKLPVDIGGKLSDAVFTVGKRWIRSRQSKALKEFIPAGNVLISTMSDNLVAALDSNSLGTTSFKELINSGKSDFKDKYQRIVFSRPGGINFSNVKIYYETLNRYDTLESLRLQCVVTAKKIKSCHETLTRNIQSKKNIKVIFNESTDLIVDVQKLKKAYESLSN